jgi:hypothetical protein
MSIEFKNKTTQGIGTGFTDVYVCPGTAKSAVIFGMTISNVNSSNYSIEVESRIEDLSATTYTHIIAPATPIDVGSSLVPAGGIQKIVLETGDKLQVSCNLANSADVMVSVLEIS